MSCGDCLLNIYIVVMIPETKTHSMEEHFDIKSVLECDVNQLQPCLGPLHHDQRNASLYGQSSQL